MNLITLTTDFGLKDPFVGMMKGVIYSINGTAQIVDISHGITSQDILEAAFVISASYRFFPERTIHLVIVDPGVGGRRRPILVKASGHYFMGPDNGVFSWVIDADPAGRVIEVTAEEYFLKNVSATFHGRDIFAPAAAWLSTGVAPDSFGREIHDYIRLDVPKITEGANDISGRVLYIDRFGNMITNISAGVLNHLMPPGISASNISVRVGGVDIVGLKRYYAEAAAGEPGSIISSFDLLEIYVYMGNASKTLNVRKGDIVEVRRQDEGRKV